MTIDTLFGTKPGRRPRSLRLKVIRPVYETLAIGDTAAAYLSPLQPFSSAAQVAAFFSFLGRETKEHFLALHLDNKNHLLCLEIVAIGSLTAAVVHPREVFKSALLSSAAGLLLLHNHPSGDPEPSREDLDISRRLKDGAELLGIRLLDHVILGGEGRYVSLADRGIL